jgi:hypothetical protein
MMGIKGQFYFFCGVTCSSVDRAESDLYNLSSQLFKTLIDVKGRVADSHHFNTDPDQDPSFCCYAELDATFHFNADPDPNLDPAPH